MDPRTAAVTAGIIVLAIAFLWVLLGGVRIVNQVERGIVFRFGRIRRRIRKPGLTIIVPMIDRLRKVNVQVVTRPVPSQEGITRDNVSVTVDAVVYFRVGDPVQATIEVQNYLFAVEQVTLTSLRSIIGKSELDDLLANRDHMHRELTDVLAPTLQGWGIELQRVEIKDVQLPAAMKRSMSRQAEAERERRARVITADGEYQAARRLADASAIMAETPGALQLRLLQTVVEVAAEKNSTLVMPLPVELLRFFDKMAQPSTSDVQGVQGVQEAPEVLEGQDPPPRPRTPLE